MINVENTNIYRQYTINRLSGQVDWLFTKYNRILVGIVQSKLPDHNRDDAEELVQGVWLDTWKRVASGSLSDCSLGWLLTLAANDFLDHMRKLRRQAKLRRVHADSLDWGRDREVGAGDAFNRVRVNEILDRLPEREQLILQRSGMEGWTEREIAEESDVSRSYVRRTLKRIREITLGTERQIPTASL